VTTNCPVINWSIDGSNGLSKESFTGAAEMPLLKRQNLFLKGASGAFDIEVDGKQYRATTEI